jgi:transcription elongation factor Elf1
MTSHPSIEHRFACRKCARFASLLEARVRVGVFARTLTCPKCGNPLIALTQKEIQNEGLF